MAESNDELKDATMIKTIKQGLDTISGDLIAVIDDILPVAISSINKNTFRLQEARLAVNGNWDNSSSRHDVICSNCYLHEAGDSTTVTKLKLGCDCLITEGAHDSELGYQGEH